MDDADFCCLLRVQPAPLDWAYSNLWVPAPGSLGKHSSKQAFLGNVPEKLSLAFFLQRKFQRACVFTRWSLSMRRALPYPQCVYGSSIECMVSSFIVPVFLTITASLCYFLTKMYDANPSVSYLLLILAINLTKNNQRWPYCSLSVVLLWLSFPVLNKLLHRIHSHLEFQNTGKTSTNSLPKYHADSPGSILNRPPCSWNAIMHNLYCPHFYYLLLFQSPARFLCYIGITIL